jgi:hypothetical protein
MDEDLKKAWLRLSEARLRAHLTQLQYPPDMVDDILRRVRGIKEAERRKRIRHGVSESLWDKVILPAKAELKSVRVIRAQAKKSAVNEAKTSALDLYISVLSLVIKRLQGVKQSGVNTPLEFADALREAKKLPTTGDGTHWTHYVSDKSKRQVYDAFMRVPKPPRGRLKEPFPVNITRGQWEIKRRELGLSIAQAQAEAQRVYDEASSSFDKEEAQDLLRQLNYASYKLDALPPRSLLPANWKGLL